MGNMKRQKGMVSLLTALVVLLAAFGSLCGAVYHEAISPELYGEKSRAAVAREHGMSGDDAVSAYIGMDAARQEEAAKIIALYMELGKGDTPLALEELNAKEISHMADVRGIVEKLGKMRTLWISLAAGLTVVIGLHRLLFANDNWLLDPATDMLIRMMPQTLFETAFADVMGQFARAFVLALVLMAAVYAVVSGMVRRQLTEEKEA